MTLAKESKDIKAYSVFSKNLFITSRTVLNDLYTLFQSKKDQKDDSTKENDTKRTR